jgi:hypothetical protein
MAKKNTQKTATHYIHDSGSGVVGDSLMKAKTEDFEKISEHPEMKCFDHRGHMTELALYEVPLDILEKLKLRRLKGEMTFREFIQYGDNLPREVPPEDGQEKKRRGKTKGSSAKEQALQRLDELRRKKRSRAAVH